LNTDVATINTGQQIAMIVLLVCFCATKFVGGAGLMMAYRIIEGIFDSNTGLQQEDDSRSVIVR